MTPENMTPFQEGGLDPAIIQAMSQMEGEEQQKRALVELEQRKKELHTYLRNWLAKSMMYRRANYEPRWERLRRNAKSIYDPGKKARKEKWQNSMFVPLSMQTKEIIKSQLHRTLIGDLPYGVRPRSSGSQDEATAIQDLSLRELERSQFSVQSNDTLDDLCTYGNGFMKFTWANKVQQRRVRYPVPEPITLEVMARMAEGVPPRIAGYQYALEPRVVYRGMKSEYVSIWDLFFAEGAKDIRNSPCIQRTRMSYQTILDGVQEGWAFPESAQVLRGVWEKSPSPNERSVVAPLADQSSSDISVPRTVNEKEHTVYEAWMQLPQKWVYLRPEEQQLVQDPDRLVPAKVLFSAETLIAADENPYYDGDNCFEEMGYIHNPGSIYCTGPLEMIEQIQDHLNEDINQRKDNEQIAWNRMYAILESAIVSKADLVSRPGGGIRIKKNSTDDVRKAIMWMQTPDVANSSWQEPFHAERYAAEVTGVSRTTIGSGGTAAKDVTQTKGGMEILQQSSVDRLIYYAMMIEAKFISRVQQRTYCLVYDNIHPDDLLRTLGPQRAAIFQMRTPEEIEADYFFQPEGVFSTMHQPIRIQQWQALRDQYAGSPTWNDVEFCRVIAKAVELPSLDKIVVPLRGPDGLPIPFELIQQAMIMGGAPPEEPGKAGAEGTTPRMATKKATKNGERDVSK